MELVKQIPISDLTLSKDIYIIPDKYEVYQKLTIEDQIKQWQEEIAQYEAETEPTTEELIELGKSMHQYYFNQERKQELIERIKSYEVKEVETIIIKK